MNSGLEMARYALFVIGVVLVSAACSAGETSTQEGAGRIPSAPGGVQVPSEGNVNVARVRVYMKDGRLQAFVQGELGDGCTVLQSISQRRGNNSVHITVTSKREGEVCTMILQYLNEWVPLEGPFAPGEYIVKANKAEVRFRLVRSGTGELRVEPDPGRIPTPPYFPF
jgi:hypothetical protein